MRIFDHSNFRWFQANRQATYYGGRALRSPVVLTVPYAGHWHLVIDFGGLRGQAKFQVQVLRATG